MRFLAAASKNIISIGLRLQPPDIITINVIQEGNFYLDTQHIFFTDVWSRTCGKEPFRERERERERERGKRGRKPAAATI